MILRKIFRAVIFFFLAAFGALNLYPLLWMLMYSFKDGTEIFVTNPLGFPQQFRFDNYVRAFTGTNIPTAFANSALVTVFSVIGAVFLASTFAYAVARSDWKWRGPARMFVMMGMFIPLQIIIIPLAILVRDLKLSNTYPSLIVPYIAFNIPFATMIFYGYLRTLPFELEESATIDGATFYQAFFKIIMPMIAPALISMVIFLSLAVWNEFFLALMLINKTAMKTLPLMVLAFQGHFSTDWGAIGAVLVISSIPTVLLYLFFSKQVEKAMSISVIIKG